MVRDGSRSAELAGRDDVQLMAMRAGELSPQRRRLVMELLNIIYREEQAAGQDDDPQECQ